MNDFESWTDTDGHLHLRAQGPGGAVLAEAWEQRGMAIGILAFHSGHPLRDGHQPQQCAEHEGPCYLAIASKEECFVLGEMMMADREANAWLAISQWFNMLGFGLAPEALLAP